LDASFASPPQGRFERRLRGLEGWRGKIRRLPIRKPMIYDKYPESEIRDGRRGATMANFPFGIFRTTNAAAQARGFRAPDRERFEIRDA